MSRLSVVLPAYNEGLIGLSMMLGSTFSPAQLSELVDELRTMR